MPTRVRPRRCELPRRAVLLGGDSNALMDVGHRAPHQRGDVLRAVHHGAAEDQVSGASGLFAAENVGRTGPHLRRDSTSASAPRGLFPLSLPFCCFVCLRRKRRSLTCPQAEIANTELASAAARALPLARHGRQRRQAAAGAAADGAPTEPSEPTCAAAASDATCAARCASPFNARHAPCSVRRDANAVHSERTTRCPSVVLFGFVCLFSRRPNRCRRPTETSRLRGIVWFSTQGGTHRGYSTGEIQARR